MKMKAIFWDEASQGMKFNYEEIRPSCCLKPRSGARTWSRRPPKPAKS